MSRSLSETEIRQWINEGNLHAFVAEMPLFRFYQGYLKLLAKSILLRILMLLLPLAIPSLLYLKGVELLLCLTLLFTFQMVLPALFMLIEPFSLGYALIRTGAYQLLPQRQERILTILLSCGILLLISPVCLIAVNLLWPVFVISFLLSAILIPILLHRWQHSPEKQIRGEWAVIYIALCGVLLVFQTWIGTILLLFPLFLRYEKALLSNFKNLFKGKMLLIQ